MTATTIPPGLQRCDDLHGAMIIGLKSDKGGSTPIAILSPSGSPRTPTSALPACIAPLKCRTIGNTSAGVANRGLTGDHHGCLVPIFETQSL